MGIACEFGACNPVFTSPVAPFIASPVINSALVLIPAKLVLASSQGVCSDYRSMRIDECRKGGDLIASDAKDLVAGHAAWIDRLLISDVLHKTRSLFSPRSAKPRKQRSGWPRPPFESVKVLPQMIGLLAETAAGTERTAEIACAKAAAKLMLVSCTAQKNTSGRLAALGSIRVHNIGMHQ